MIYAPINWQPAPPPPPPEPLTEDEIVLCLQILADQVSWAGDGDAIKAAFLLDSRVTATLHAKLVVLGLQGCLDIAVTRGALKILES